MRAFLLALLLTMSLTSIVSAARPNEIRRMRVTSYSACDVSIRVVKACDGITASGRRVQWGVVACGRAFPFGTVFDIPDLGLFACYDRGGGIGNDHLDVYTPSGRLWSSGGRWLDVTVRYDVDPSEVLGSAGEALVEVDANPVQTEQMAASSVQDSPVVGALLAPATRGAQQEHSLGNLVADMLRTEYGADVGLVPNGLLRTGLSAGEVRAAQISALLHGSPKPLELQLRGDQLRRLIEHALSHVDNDWHWLNVSGIRLVYSPKAPVGQRITGLYRYGADEPVWDARVYRVVIPDALYFTDGYTPLLDVGRGLITYEPFADMAPKWLKQRGQVTPKIEGRVTTSP